MAQRQLNVRLSEEAVGILEAAAFVESVPSVAELVKPLLDGFVADLGRDPAVQSALRLRLERAAMREGKLAPLDSRRRGDAS